MMHVADDREWINHFGEAPHAEESSGDEDVGELKTEPQPGELLHLTWDINHCDFRVQWWQDGIQRLDARQGRITQISPRSRPGVTAVVAYYERDGHHDDWTIVVQVWPHFRYSDSIGNAWLDQGPGHTQDTTGSEIGPRADL